MLLTTLPSSDRAFLIYSCIVKYHKFEFISGSGKDLEWCQFKVRCLALGHFSHDLLSFGTELATSQTPTQFLNHQSMAATMDPKCQWLKKIHHWATWLSRFSCNILDKTFLSQIVLGLMGQVAPRGWFASNLYSWQVFFFENWHFEQNLSPGWEATTHTSNHRILHCWTKWDEDFRNITILLVPALKYCSATVMALLL